MRYFYQREIVDGSWNINNPNRVDAFGEQIYLAKEVSDYFINSLFRLFCVGSDVIFVFDNALSESDKLILDTIVFNHKNNL